MIFGFFFEGRGVTGKKGKKKRKRRQSKIFYLCFWVSYSRSRSGVERSTATIGRNTKAVARCCRVYCKRVINLSPDSFLF